MQDQLITRIFGRRVLPWLLLGLMAGGITVGLLITKPSGPPGQHGEFTVSDCSHITDDDYMCNGDFRPDHGLAPDFVVPIMDPTVSYPPGTRVAAAMA
jgi:hypothetical protein